MIDLGIFSLKDGWWRSPSECLFNYCLDNYGGVIIAGMEYLIIDAWRLCNTYSEIG